MSVDQMDIHTWFSLTYANYLVLPRAVLQSMPDEWQHRFVECLQEMERAFYHLDWPTYMVTARDSSNGRFKRDPIPHYWRGRTRIEPACEIEPNGYVTQRDRWIRLFNRLDGAITHHERDKTDGFMDEIDEALYAARKKVLKDAASRD